jgi:DNA-binding IscR family transcriptional regulator
MNIGLTPFDYRLYGTIRDYQDEKQGLVPARLLAERLMLSGRTVRHYLSRLVNAGMVFRPEGRNSGYSVMPTVRSMALRKAKKWKADELDKADVLILQLLFAKGRTKTGEMCIALGLSPRSLRYRMAKLERLELVRRPAGSKSGYEAMSAALECVALAEAKHHLKKLSLLRLRLLERMVDLAQDSPMMLHSEHLAVWADLKPRTMRYHLNALEKRGLLTRPKARNGGYQLVKVVVVAVLNLAREEGLIWHA